MFKRIINMHKLTIANGEALSAAFDFRGWSGGMVIVPSAWTAANIGFQVCDEEAGTFAIARDDDGAPLNISSILTNGSRAYELPPELFGAHYVKLWSKSATDATETGVNQGADRALTVMLKS